MDELTKEDWYLILEEDFKRCGEKYDTLKVLSVVKIENRKNGGKIRCNYKTTRGDWSTGFGVYDVDKKEIPALIREVRIKKILSK